MADRAATSLTGAQSHSAKPEEQSRSMLAATVITGQQVRPGSQVSKTRSGPVRYVAKHRHTRSIAEARAKGKVFERTNTSSTTKFQMRHLPALCDTALPGSRGLELALSCQTPRQDDRQSLLMYLGP